MSVILFDNVSYRYNRSEKFALNGIDLSVAKGEFLAVMGETGAGKTTLCKLINGIIPHHSGGSLTGTVTVDGICTALASVPELALKAGMVLDDPDAQLFTSSVFNEVAFGPENICLPVDEINKRVKSALSAVGLEGFEERAPSTLSGGEKQRLSIAAALAMNGKILVLDEPLCRLDPHGAREVMSVFNSIREKYQITIIITIHNTELAAEYADRVCILKNGRITVIDTAKNILTDSALLEENGIQPLDTFKNYKSQSYIVLTDSSERWAGFDSFEIQRINRTTSYHEDENNYETSHDTLCNSVVDIKNMTFKYPNGAGIENINLSIYENDFTAIIGNNGCGKTTLLKNITGLLRPASGHVFIRGKNTKELSVSDISKEIGFVMQNPDNQLFTDTVYNEVAFALKNTGLPNTIIKQRVEEALEITGIKDTDAFPHALIRPDRTKTVITCVLAMGCKIIIFDEIDAGNDYNGNLKLMNIAQDLHNRGFTIIFVTHNMYLAAEYARRIIKIERTGVVSDERRN